ncbi:hypothetical protein GGP85_002960 [Salinibacter ruber]|uniref:O-antigen ligase family protein n=1 Tax=Salinibacter ruber TaxID=146919 RepID=UPI002169EF9F|nr:hypothetical protein [Salinibacter ruber]MCS3827490.1 hypothetical protein [Salinibacter ruber]
MKLWKWLVGLFFLLVIVDGALRKWVLPGYSTALFVLKDAALWGGFLMYSFRRSATELPRPLRSTWIPVLLGGYVYLVMVQAFNPRMPGLIVSAIGLKAHLAFLPLVVLTPAFIAEVTDRQMTSFLWGYALLIVLPLAALSVYQFYSPPTAWINQYVREMKAIATAGGHARVNAAFPYVGSHTVYLTFNAFLSAGVLLAGLRWERRELSILGTGLLGILAVVLPMTGSRGPILVITLALATLLIVAEVHRRLQFLGIAILMGGVFVLGIGGTGLAGGWNALLERMVQTGGVEGAEERILKILDGPAMGLERGGLFGYGAGSLHQAAPRFVPGASGREWLPKGGPENGIARSMMELGVLGWLFLLTLKGTLLYFAHETLQRAHRPLELIVGVTAFCLLLVRLPFPVIFNPVLNAFYWGTAGAMLGVWSIQQLRAQAHSVSRRSVATPRS